MNPQSLVMPKETPLIGFGLRAAVFLAVLLAAFGLLAPVALIVYGAAGVNSLVLAWVIIAVPNFIAMAVDVYLASPRQALLRMGIGGALRTGWPLAAVAALAMSGTDLQVSGLGYFVLAFYVAALAVEIGLLYRESRAL